MRKSQHTRCNHQLPITNHEPSGGVRLSIRDSDLAIGDSPGTWVGLLMMMVMVLAMVLVGCQSPPSVGPLLTVVDEAMAAEAARLTVDADRAVSWIDQQRGALTDGFDADLRERAELDVGWVRDHAMVYATARELLTRHEMTLAREYDTRRQNLADARRAQQAAIMLIEQQDRLFEKVPDARRWFWE